MHATAQKRRDATGDFDRAAGLCLSVAETDLFTHQSGVLFWETEETLIVSDLHLEKGSSFATKQIFLPPYDTAATLSLLNDAISGFQPKRLIALGDSFHDENAATRLNESDFSFLKTLVSSLEWIWIAGNHDPKPPADLGGDFIDEFRLGNLTFRHEPQIGSEAGEIAGHLHPSAKVRGRGRSVRKRCFLANSRRLILPAFGAFTGGLNVRDEAFHPLFPANDFHAYMMGRDRLYPIAAKSCLPG